MRIATATYSLWHFFPNQCFKIECMQAEGKLANPFHKAAMYKHCVIADAGSMTIRGKGRGA